MSQPTLLVDTHSAISTPVTATTGLASSVSTTATSTSSNMSNSGVPDFTEFKLDPFHLDADSGTPAPHRLREARRSLALYLEPCENTAFYRSLQEFQERSFVRFGPNQAHSATPHIAVLGRVHIERGRDALAKWHTVDEFITVVQEELKEAHLLPPPIFCGYEIIDRPSRALTMRFRVDPAYEALAKRIENRMASQCAAFDIRPMDRMQLAYNVLRPIPRPVLKQIRDLAKETVQVEIGGAWKLTLYEIMLESRVVGVQQQVSEIQSWPVRPPAVESASSILPMSLRVKLAVLATWLHCTPPTVIVDTNSEDDKPQTQHATSSSSS